MLNSLSLLSAGKAFQCGLAFRKLGVAPIVLSGAELASGAAGDPSLALRQCYLEAGEAVRKGRMCALLVSDLEAGELVLCICWSFTLSSGESQLLLPRSFGGSC